MSSVNDDRKIMFMRRITVMKGIRTVGNDVFDSLSMRNLWAPKSKERLWESGFRQAKSILSVSFESPPSLKRIEGHAFSCWPLKFITIPSTVEILCSACFAQCKSLVSVFFELPSSLRVIESQAFARSSLQSIVIPSSVEIICPATFTHCKSLSSFAIESGSSLKQIEVIAFLCSSLDSIVIPKSVQFIAGDSFRSTPLNNFSIEPGNEVFEVYDQFLISKLEKTLIHAFDQQNDVNIPSFIEIIGERCFSDCRLLSSVSFPSPSSLIRIEAQAFARSSLKSIVIPCHVESLGLVCFLLCKSLSSV
jgi:hypothetical protein